MTPRHEPSDLEREVLAELLDELRARRRDREQRERDERTAESLVRLGYPMPRRGRR